MVGMLVSSHTVQVWLSWDVVPKDISDQVEDQRDGDIIVFTPHITELSGSLDRFLESLNVDIRMPRQVLAGTLLIKRGKNVEVSTDNVR